MKHILPSGAHNICSVRVQRAWRGHCTRKAVLGNGAFVFRDLIRIARVLSRHDWRLHERPPLLFLELAFIHSFPLLVYNCSSRLCRFRRNISASPSRNASTTVQRPAALLHQPSSSSKAASVNIHLFIDITALSVFASSQPSPRIRWQTSTCGAHLSPVSPAGIVVSLQYSLPLSRRILFPSHCAAKISVCLMLYATHSLRNSRYWQAWWLHRQSIEVSFANRASLCFTRRLLRHVQSCIDVVTAFLDVISGLAADCGLSRRDVSQCVGPFDQVLLCLSRIHCSAGAGDDVLLPYSGSYCHCFCSLRALCQSNSLCSIFLHPWWCLFIYHSSIACVLFILLSCADAYFPHRHYARHTQRDFIFGRRPLLHHSGCFHPRSRFYWQGSCQFCRVFVVTCNIHFMLLSCVHRSTPCFWFALGSRALVRTSDFPWATLVILTLRILISIRSHAAACL